KIALACKKYGCKIAINSDAHSMYKIGDVQKVADMIEDIDFPKELIINADWQQLKNELKLHNKSIIKFI
ncbi:MAG: phosphatase, partial [Oscillospiraceae bacterium]